MLTENFCHGSLQLLKSKVCIFKGRTPLTRFQHLQHRLGLPNFVEKHSLHHTPCHRPHLISLYKTHSALDHEAPGREQHKAVGCEHMGLDHCPCAALSCPHSRGRQSLACYTPFSSRKLHCAHMAPSIKSRTAGSFECSL